jgi:asparagine synthase (glutamine-hydrolysing)
MLDLLKHRGPDGEGVLDDGNIAIGMRRLAIIDVAGGNQPIPNEDGSIWVVYNGEIYNYLKFRQRLEQQGHRLKTQSDTEVLVHLYEELGERMLQELRGMFALCIYDRRDASLFLARDPFGEKPLFYALVGNTLVFASEIASLLTWEGIPRRLDLEALGYYLRANVVPAPLTMFQDVRQVEPGCWMRWKNGALSHGRYWTPDYTCRPELEDERQATGLLGEAIRRAVSRQMVSERPLGVFLSGGIDSSTIASFSQETSSRPVRTLTVAFEEPSYDESNVARLVAEAVGSEHQEFHVQNARFEAELFWRIVDHVGVPFADSSAMPTYLLSKAAAQQLTVCLSGDGGDEMFAGYLDFRWGLAVHTLGKLPQTALRWGESLATWTAKVRGFRGSQHIRQASRALQAAQAQGLGQQVAMGSLFSPGELRALIVDPRLQQPLDAPPERLTTLPPQAEEWSPLRCLMYYHTKHILAEDMLVKVDRMSMACSLEVRAPLLDLDVANVAMALPDRHLIRNGEQKYLLRQILKDRLPPAVLAHPKTGFSIPLHRFQNRAYQDLAAELLDSSCAPMAMLSSGALQAIKARALTRERDFADASVYRATHQLWALMQLAGWAVRFNVSA